MRRLALPAAYIWLFLIILYTTAPFPSRDTDPVAGAVWILRGYTPLYDAIINLLMLVPSGALICIGLRDQMSLAHRVWTATLINGFVSSYAEISQTVIPGRVPSMADLLLNTTGALLGAAIVMFWERRSRLE